MYYNDLFFAHRLLYLIMRSEGLRYLKGDSVFEKDLDVI